MWSAAITAFFQSLRQAFSLAETAKEKQCETDVLKEKKKLDKTSDKQEDLLFDMSRLLEKYIGVFGKKDRMLARMYIRRVKRVN